jgi:hypothetical protein
MKSIIFLSPCLSFKSRFVKVILDFLTAAAQIGKAAEDQSPGICFVNGL